METQAKHKIEAVRYPTIDYWGNLAEGWSGFRATWEPGDGTNYQIWGQRVKNVNAFGCLGSVADGWMVICSLNARAYLFQASGGLAVAYVAEKFDLGNAISAKTITALIGFATVRETDVKIRIVKRPAPKSEEVDPRD